MDLINLINICTCSYLTEENKPFKKKKDFNKLDENIILWGEIKNISKDTDIDILWYTPNNKKVFSLTIPIKKTTSTQPSRYFWGVMKFELIYFLNENPYGNWKISIPKLKIIYEFNIRNLNNNYKNNISQNENIALLDIRY